MPPWSSWQCRTFMAGHPHGLKRREVRCSNLRSGVTTRSWQPSKMSQRAAGSSAKNNSGTSGRQSQSGRRFTVSSTGGFHPICVHSLASQSSQIKHIIIIIIININILSYKLDVIIKIILNIILQKFYVCAKLRYYVYLTGTKHALYYQVRSPLS